MIIAISQRNTKTEKGANRDTLENDYVRYYEKFGITLLPIPNVCKDLEKYFNEIPIKAIILSGGNDVNPALYAGKQENEDFSEDRDETEKKLIEIAIKRKIPLIGICRGMQFINVFFKGSIVKNIKSKTGINHVDTTHKVKITDDKAKDFLGKETLSVNSYHKQGIDKNSLSSELKSFAITEEGFIEGIYHPEYPLAGIQWHPERESPDEGSNKKIIDAFLKGELFWKK